MSAELIILFSIFGTLSIINLLLTLAIIRKVNNIQERRSNVTNRVDDVMFQRGIEIPDYQFETDDGKAINIKSITGSGETVFVFMSSTCSPCEQKIPELQELYPIAKTKNICINIVLMGDNKSSSHFIDKTGYTHPILHHKDLILVQNDLKLSGTPSFYWVSENRVIIERGILGDGNWIQMVNQNIYS